MFGSSSFFGAADRPIVWEGVSNPPEVIQTRVICFPTRGTHPIISMGQRNTTMKY